MTLPTIQKYARAVQDEVGTEGVWGFIDGTMRPFCRPGENQEEYYSGHKKNHGFQFQCIMTPDGQPNRRMTVMGRRIDQQLNVKLIGWEDEWEDGQAAK